MIWCAESFERFECESVNILNVVEDVWYESL